MSDFAQRGQDPSLPVGMIQEGTIPVNKPMQDFLKEEKRKK